MKIKHKKRVFAIALICLFAFFVSACGKSQRDWFATAYKAEIITPPYELAWGTTKNDALKTLGIKTSDTEVRSFVGVDDMFTEYTVVPKIHGEKISLMLFFSSETTNKKVNLDLGLQSLQVLIHDEETSQEITKLLIGDVNVNNDLNVSEISFKSSKNVSDYLKGNLIETDVSDVLQKLYSLNETQAKEMIKGSSLGDLSKIIVPDELSVISSELSSELEGEPLYSILYYSGALMPTINQFI